MPEDIGDDPFLGWVRPGLALLRHRVFHEALTVPDQAADVELIVHDPFAEALQSAAREHYGHVLPVFVQRIIAQHSPLKDTLHPMVTRLRNLMLAANGKEGPVLRVLTGLALIAVAGEIGTRLGVLPWRKGTATSALVEIAVLWHGLMRRVHRRPPRPWHSV